jgi:hypothetical protein
MTEGKNRIMVFGPKSDGTYVVEFRTAAERSERHALRDGSGSERLGSGIFNSAIVLQLKLMACEIPHRCLLTIC